MSVEATPTTISPERIKKASNLKVQITKFTPFDGGVTEAVVTSGTNPNKTYTCSMSAIKASCQCEDFMRNLQSCKHIAAMVMVSLRVWQGLSISDFR